MRLTGNRIAFLLAGGVEELEFFVPFTRLQEEGADVITAGSISSRSLKWFDPPFR
jgi:deglycase